MEALRAAAVRGLGIGYMQDFLAREALADGSVQSVLDEHLLYRGQFWALSPSSRHLLLKIRMFCRFHYHELFAADV
jgi:DNA-binding transcriptional LysR family regulator